MVYALSTVFGAMNFPEPKPPKEREKEIREEIAAGVKWSEDHLISSEEISCRERDAEPARFNVISLTAWLAIADHAGVPSIPARQIATTCATEYFLVMDALSDGSGIDAFSDEIVENLKEGEILRFEQVAPGDVKASLSDGGEISNGLIRGVDGKMFPEIYDERFYSTLRDLGSAEIRAFVRPYIPPMKESGQFDGADGNWPIEFRVFIRDGQISGLANYYRQMGMGDSGAIPEATIRKAVDGALSSAQAMLDAMQNLGLGIGNKRIAPGSDTAGKEGWDRQDFTLDFLLSAKGEVLFLEGGPAGMTFADPCAFLTEGARTISLEGVALSVKRPPVSMEEWQGGLFRHPEIG